MALPKIRVIPCPTCAGAGQVSLLPRHAARPVTRDCPRCGGRRTVLATVKPLGPRVARPR